ncbi:phospholipase B1, membrane-associated-like isoform X2 [Mixophyes fleayi]|uniref:phospholipase B1, membrane-associated-like isoform X2 n=1 Tax=Mixophyes fleayi TaxID=3061075 RepID=UPI003F4E2186
MGSYMDGVKEQISVHGLQQFPEKSRGRSSPSRDLVCPNMSPSAETPSTADRVRPADVRVVAGLGDSVTAAIGANATNILELPTEYRQFSWSIGGYGNLSDVITLPNIFKIFNPNLVGFAKRSTVSYRPASLEDAGLNLAITGANTFLLPTQVRLLIDTLKSLPGVNFEDDWKVVTIFIGSNDVCDYCKNKTLFSPDSFIHNVTVSLDLLKKELPRSIINVVQLLDVGRLRQVNDKSFGCILQRFFCSCVVKPKENSSELLEVLHQNKQFQNGHIDYSFFTPDCFHLTIKGHEQMATGLWNNMLQPEGEKYQLKTFSEEVKLLCPSEDHPYIYTKTPESTSAASCVLRGSRLVHTLFLLAVTLCVSI